MNKVISINLGGKSYQVEELGYEALSAYLEEAGRHLAENPDKAEIMADLERAIADKCARHVSAHKDVVTTAEVERILVEMGPVSGEEHAHAGAQSEKSDGGSHKKLFLIREGAVLGGVSTGIAAYLGVDVTLVRVVFVALTVLTGGGFIFAYIAAMILIPYADTSEQKAAARGLPFNAQELVNRARKSYQQFSERKEWGYAHWNNWKTQRHQWKHDHRAWKRAARAQKSGYGNHPLFGAISALFALVWIVGLIGLITSGTIFGIALPAGVPLWVAIVILFVLFHAVTGPLQAGRTHHGYGDPWFALVDGIGILFIAIAFAFCYIHYPSVQEFVNHIPTYIHDWYLRITN